MSLCDPRDPDSILRRNAALKRLAAGLVVVSEDAEDVVQDTWVAALSRRAGPVRSPDGWLFRVACYQAARRRRRDVLRRERELRVARSALTEPEYGTASARILEALEALREPYRSVISLRFEEDLLPEEIARRLARPVTTVKSQLNRGLKLIRARLPEPEDGRSRRWAWLSLSKLLRPRAFGLDRFAATWVAISTACCVLLVVLIRGNERDIASSAPPVTDLAVATHDTALRLPRSVLAPPGRVPVMSDERAPVLAITSRETLVVTGTVSDRDGNPVPEARIWVAFRGASEDATVVTKARQDGRFRLDGVDPEAWISADGDGWLRSGWASLPAAATGSSASVELSLRVVETSRRIEGVVRDDLGRPIQGARVLVHDERRESWLHQGGWRVPGSGPGPTSAADGTFELDLHTTLSQWLLVSAAGHAPAFVGALSRKRERVPVEVILTRGETLRGQATFPSGEPAANATVEFRPDAPFPTVSERTRPDGTFEVPHLPLGPGTLVVLAQGEHSALSYRSRLEVLPASQPVRAVLGTESTIEGVATDVRGRPLAGWTVAATRDEDRGAILDRVGPGRGASVRARTDAQGRFALGGLPAAAHRLHLLAPGEESARATLLVALPSGGLPISLVAADELVRLTGRLHIEPAELASCGLVARSPALLRDRSARVDAATGAFALEGLPPGSYELLLWDPAGPPALLGSYSVDRGTVEVGGVEVPGKGSLQLRLRAPGDLAVEPVVVLLRSLEGYGALQDQSGMQRTAPGEITTGPIRVGRYELVVKARGYADFVKTVDVEHLLQPLHIDLQPGALLNVWIRTLQPLLPGQEVRLRAEDLQGVLADQSFAFSPRSNPDKTTWNSPLGTFRIHAVLETGEEASTVVEISPVPHDDAHGVLIDLPDPKSSGGHASERR